MRFPGVITSWPLVGASVFTLAWPLAGYPAVLWVLARLRERREAPVVDDESLPAVTVIVPTYMESANMRARLDNLAVCRYPRERFEVIVVDPMSPDGTAEIAETFAREHPELRLRVIREPRRAGKAAATNRALSEASGELILVTDAPTRFDRDAVALIASNFADPRVGAATGTFEVFEERTVTQREEGLFWRIRNILRTLEAEVDSTPFLSGELCCFRRSLIREIDADSIADDMNVALQVRRAGYRAIVDSRARFSEPRSPALRALMIRKTSRAAGGIQELLRHRHMIFSRRHGLFGMLIMPSDVFYYLPLRVPALAVLAAVSLRGHPWRALTVAPIAAVALRAPKARERVRDATFVAALNEWLFLLGWLSVLSGRLEVLWPQEPRTVVPGAAWGPSQEGGQRAAG